MTHSVVRSALFVPASRPERIPKALAAGADTVIVDLEDAVEHLAKSSAREALCDFLGTHRDAHLWVRINDASTSWHDDDLKACRGRPNIAGILLPKAESLAQVRHVAQTGLPVIPIIETARGLLNASEVAATPGVARLAFGSLDYALDMGLTPDTPGADTVLDHARVQVLLHSRAASLAPALDGVFAGVQDTAGLAEAASRAQQMGFGGMLCIHPAQVPVIHAAFVPAREELEWARRVIAAHRDTAAGTFMLDGRMVDAPVIARARLVLAQAGEQAPA
ncbi:HpcH/HpaI aldolase/citrate lyase family protein [Achromobacter piechaudii]|uniref:Citrate lyase subunit beta-like protein n=1 Tax=Achromobacter piechaudii TaxID=72556 RepID=A0A6S7E8M4_9BURK|nr:CoA ester lyase [Achromobacter piechaudii]CAB3709093.1 Citrate lyase subunit beta-like protein [Achromobacter piechaudii]CAB3874521.1 Citrate lyase subunit beta-like protein [Achromobacter piechaudii]CAB3899790.1 Citrate lyase subunit beta-like protein [Achromobacter piechaudii]CAB3953698.1 Citrate lyase subunit beta-like protein [Achromobacter piechaudii]